MRRFLRGGQVRESGAGGGSTWDFTPRQPGRIWPDGDERLWTGRLRPRPSMGDQAPAVGGLAGLVSGGGEEGRQGGEVGCVSPQHVIRPPGSASSSRLPFSEPSALLPQRTPGERW